MKILLVVNTNGKFGGFPVGNPHMFIIAWKTSMTIVKNLHTIRKLE
jgi:hypothetical protein